MHVKSIILDVDGTLVDSNDRHADCWMEAFAHFGVRVEWETIRGQIGKGGDLLVPDTLNAKQMREIGQKLKDHRGELWKRRYMPEIKAFPGVTEAMQKMKARGLKLALASSANPDEVEYYLELLDAGELVETTTSKEDAEFSKPSPEIFEAALSRMGGDAATALAIGDTPYDILAAHRAGIAITAVLSGGFPAETLMKAEYLFENLVAFEKELDRIDDDFR
jgi:HAD superfamily hydrolase (TIGR01549 family)